MMMRYDWVALALLVSSLNLLQIGRRQFPNRSLWRTNPMHTGCVSYFHILKRFRRKEYKQNPPRQPQTVDKANIINKYMFQEVVVTLLLI